MNRLRRAPLKRLVAACVAAVLVGAGVAVAASAIGGPTPPPAPLAQAIDDAITSAPVQGITADVTFTDNLVTGAALQSQSPLITGASGRVWFSSDGRARLELQSDDGDTEIVWDGTTLSYLDAASGTVYRYTPPAHGADASGDGTAQAHAVPTVADIQRAITRPSEHADVSGAMPDDVAGQPAYSVRISPAAGHGGLFGGIALWWDATHGVPLRFAVYAAGQSDPVLELTADDVSYGPIDPSVFAAPTAAKVVVLGGSSDSSQPAAPGAAGGSGPAQGVTLPGAPGAQLGVLQPAIATQPSRPVTGTAAVSAQLPFALSAPSTLAGMSLDQVRLIRLRGRPAALLTYGEGLGGLLVVQRASAATAQNGNAGGLPLPAVSVNGAPGSELATALGTIVSFERDGVTYLVAGSVPAATALDAARGL